MNQKESLEWALDRCRKSGMRCTSALKGILHELIIAGGPQRLSDFAESDSLRDSCDRATVYRLLNRLEERGLVRRIGLHDRAAYFAIKFPGKHDDYLICTECGEINRLEMSCPVEALEKEVGQKFGFQNLYHELEFFGTCSKCA